MDQGIAFADAHLSGTTGMEISDSSFEIFNQHKTLAARRAPELLLRHALGKSEGAGKTGCALHPRSRVHVHVKRNAHEHTGSAENTPAFPAQWFPGLLRALPGERLSCHRRPLEALASKELDTSTAVSGPHDFAVRFMPRSSVAACAPIASPRTFVTIASAPHLAVRRAHSNH